MVLVEIKNDVGHYSSNEDGQKLYYMIDQEFKNLNTVEISFEGVSGLSSSFINSAFIELLNQYDFNFIKKHLKFTHSNKQINSLILSRFKFELSKCAI